MDRTFHRPFSFASVAGALLLGVLSLLLFWQCSGGAALLGAATALLMVIAVVRITRTTYVITDSGKLVVSKGALSRRVEVDLADIESVERVSNSIARTSCLAVVCRGKTIFVQPDNEKAFVGEIARRRGGRP